MPGKNGAPLACVVKITSDQKVEHYEIAGYGTVKTYAEMLGKRQAATLLDQALSEECSTDERLTRLAESHINVETMRYSDSLWICAGVEVTPSRRFDSRP